MLPSKIFSGLALMASVAALPGIATGCGSDARDSCAGMRAEFAALPSGPQQAWNDIEGLQESIEHGLQLRADIAAQCS